MSVGCLDAFSADENARVRLRIRSDPTAAGTDSSRSAAINQKHRLRYPSRNAAKAHGVSRQKRAKPPRLIPLKCGRTVVFPRQLPSQFTPALADSPTQRLRSQRGPSVAQRCPTHSPIPAAAVPPTSPPEPDTIPERLDAPRAVGSPQRRSPGGNERFTLQPSVVPRRSPRTYARHSRAWLACPTASASAGSRRPRTSDQVRYRSRRAQ